MRSIQDYAEFTAAFLDALKIDSAVIVGRSMGGAVAMDFALRFPKRTQALILIATSAKFTIPADRIEGMRAVTMGRAPQAFNTDGYSPKTVKENVKKEEAEEIKKKLEAAGAQAAIE